LAQDASGRAGPGQLPSSTGASRRRPRPAAMQEDAEAPRTGRQRPAASLREGPCSTRPTLGGVDSLVDVLVWVDSTLRDEREALNSLLDCRHAMIRQGLEARLICHGGCSSNDAAGDGGGSSFVKIASDLGVDSTVDTPQQEMVEDQVSVPVAVEPILAGEQGEPSQSQSKGSRNSKEIFHLRSPTACPMEVALKQHGSVNIVSKLVLSTRFEVALACLILANAIVLCFETQYRGFDIAYKADLNRTDVRPADEVWPGAKEVFDVLDIMFGACFTVELALKLVGLRQFFFLIWFNWFDMLIISAWWVGQLANTSHTENLMVLRLVRLVRLLRPLRLIHTMTMFDTLHVLVNALKSSIYIVGWSLLFVLLLLMTSAIFMNAVLESHMSDSSEGDSAADTYKYFGTFWNGVVTMFQLTFGNWVPVCRHLSATNELYGFFVLIYRFGTDVACMTVVKAVFILETFRAANTDTDLMIKQRHRDTLRHAAQMSLLFEETDKSGDGYLSFAEFSEVMRDPRVQDWLGYLNLEVRDVPVLFDLADTNRDGRISGPELVNSFAHMKGTARSVDLMNLDKRVSGIEDHGGRVLDKIDALIATASENDLNLPTPSMPPPFPSPRASIPWELPKLSL